MKTYEMANLLHVSVQTLAAYERGDRVPPLSVLDRLHAEFDISPDLWLIPDGPFEAGGPGQQRSRDDIAPRAQADLRPGLWGDAIWYLSQAVPEHTIAERLEQLRNSGVMPGHPDLVRAAREAGMEVQEIEGEWHAGTRAAYLSADPAEVSILRVHRGADEYRVHEDVARGLVTWLLALPTGACRTWADRDTNITRWHQAGSQLFGYSLDPKEWRHLRIDSFARNPGDGTNACRAEDVVRALLTDKPDERQKRIKDCTRFPLTRVERLYHKSGASFAAGITINDTRDSDETRLLVTVTNLEVPALIERLAREITVPTAILARTVRIGGASVEALARVFRVQQETVRARMAETGLWGAVYRGVEGLRWPEAVGASGNGKQRARASTMRRPEARRRLKPAAP